MCNAEEIFIVTILNMTDHILARLEAAVARLERISPPPGANPEISSSGPSWLAEYSEVEKRVLEMKKAADKTGVKEIITSSEILGSILFEFRDFLNVSGICRKPSSNEISSALGSIFSLVSKIPSDNRSDFHAHGRAVAEAANSVLLLGSPSPVSHLQGLVESCDFHLNKVLRRKIPEEIEWAKSICYFDKISRG